MNVLQAHAETLEKLQTAQYPDAHSALVWWLIEHVAQKKIPELLSGYSLSATQLQHLDRLVHRLTQERIPLAYVLGFQPFGPLVIETIPPLLIPRPETEAWVADCIEYTKKLPKPVQAIADLCSGTGCIALWLAYEYKNLATPVDIMALDKDPIACRHIQKQAQQLHVSIQVIQADLRDSELIKQLPTHYYDLVTANPPYVTDTEWQDLEPEIKNWQAYDAHVSSDQGYELIKACIQVAAHIIKPGGTFWLEIGSTQGALVKELFDMHTWHAPIIEQDFYHKDRVCIVMRK